MNKYILDENGVPKLCNNLETWGRWFETADRSVAKTIVGEAEVSTVFLSIDHNYADNGQPILYETMIFGGPRDQECDRYCTLEEAQAGHNRLVEQLRNSESGVASV